MKNKGILLGMLCVFNLSIFAQCPIQGDRGLGNSHPTKTDLKLQAIDTLKNRTKPSQVIVPISIDSVMKPGDDTKRFTSNEYVSIIAYVYEVKYGGPETCNCHDKNKTQLDIHIEIVANLSDSGPTKRMIVEINRFARASNPAMDYNLIHALKGKKVKIEGWLFFDEEHWQNSYNINPNGTNDWRGTCWEIHPVLVIEEVK